MSLPESVFVTEVGPRDGLQSEGADIPTRDKVELVNLLARTGVHRIEVTSFAHPKLVPSMADAEAVMRDMERRPGVVYSGLVPNVRGAERAVSAGVDQINVVLSATEAFNNRNLNMSISDSVESYRGVAEVARSAGLSAMVGLSVCFGCPYEGAVAPQQVLGVVERLVDVGLEEIALADTIGVANPGQVSLLVGAVRARWPRLTLGLHFHDTRGLAVANVLAGLEAGVARYEGSVGGIGACPFAPGATGNVCTEDVVHMLEGMGIRTGIDLDALIECARRVREIVGHEVPSRMVRAGPAREALRGLGSRA